MVDLLEYSQCSPLPMQWRKVKRNDKQASKIADRHYSRQTVGHPLFAPPGRCLVLLSSTNDALWVSSWPYAKYVMHEWAGAWICSIFRNESASLSSDLITQAVACTRSAWDIPDLGMVTFVDTTKVRKKRDWGRCFRKAGWQEVGKTKGGLIALQILPQDMPLAVPAMGSQLRLFSDSETGGAI